MEKIHFQPYAEAEIDLLAEWLASDRWPYHAGDGGTIDQIRTSIAEGNFTGKDNITFWMLLEEERVGLFRLTEATDETPLLDIRLRSVYRGQGLGAIGLRWLTDQVFNTMPDKIRIEGKTRTDNIAMRRTFLRCGYLKEAHYRRCWPDENDIMKDCIGYGILKEDWQNGRVTPVDWDDEATFAAGLREI